MKNGFTLIEISIVLVIIGLLTSGVLVAQSMIQSVNIMSFIRYAGQLDSAFVSFQQTYRCIPGDCSKFGGPGNDSGAIGASCAFIPGTVSGDCWNSSTNLNPETKEFWVHLSSLGFKPEGNVYNSSYNGINDAVLGENLPKVDMFVDDGTIKFNSFLPEKQYPGFGSATKNNYNFVSQSSKFARTSPSGGHQGFVDPASLLSIDVKIDDGHPAYGFVVMNPSRSFPNGDCSVGVRVKEYNLDNSDPACSVNIGMGFTIDNSNILNAAGITRLGYTP